MNGIPSGNIATKVIHEVSVPLNMAVESLDLPTLRTVFAELFDRAGEGILQAGLDFDDVELHRFVEVGPVRGSTIFAPVEWLSDRSRLMESLQQHCTRRNEHSGLGADCLKNGNAGNLTIVAAWVRAVVDSLP